MRRFEIKPLDLQKMSEQRSIAVHGNLTIANPRVFEMKTIRSVLLMVCSDPKPEQDDIDDEEPFSAEKSFEEFQLLLSGLAQLQDDGCLHQVYSASLEAVTTEESIRLLAEALHHRWLSDVHFPTVAARLCYEMAELSAGDIKFSSIVYGLIMNDYRDKIGLRSTSALLFCNSVHFTFEFFGLFRDQSPIYDNIVPILFDYLHMLLDKDSAEVEQTLVHTVLSDHGALLNRISHSSLDEVTLAVRKKLVQGNQSAKTSALLLEVIDLSYNKWEKQRFSDGIKVLYEKLHKGLSDFSVINRYKDSSLQRKKSSKKDPLANYFLQKIPDENLLKVPNGY